MKYKISILVVLFVVFFSSCADLMEDMITDTVADNQFSTVQGLDEALIATYVPLRLYYGQQNGFLMTLYGTDLFTEGQTYNPHWNDYGSGLNPSNLLRASSDVFVWDNFYRGINNANTVISRAPEVDGIDENTKNMKMAEAKFLRAHFYFVLVQHFGALHITLEETRDVELEATRSPVEEVYEVIISDLEFAAEYLPLQQTQYGRPTHDAAVNHLAKVHLTIGNWQQAADLAIAVIEGGRHHLLDSYEDVFDPFNQRHAEAIWAVQWGDNPEVNSPPNQIQRFIGPRQWLIEGLVGDNMYHIGKARFFPTPYLLTELFGNDYREEGLHIRNDMRYSVTFKEAWLYNDENNLPNGAAIGDTAAWFTNDPIVQEMSREEIEEKYPYLVIRIEDINTVYAPTVHKHRYPYQALHGRDYMYMRLGETYLIAAEALMMLGQLDDAAYYFNVLRSRAAFPGVEIPLITPAELTIDEILDERGRELAGELHRWYDLKRTGKLVARVRAHNPKGSLNIQEFHNLRPIPQTQIDRTWSDFPQNPGYN
ncbi:MAG: RagB/SusD family nutrient uptake outer membrane protein [Bacteroidetes bacterium]|nr:MAG: RagB/SusD family nutrient uptake outer membrane protein [Bacteroidota bacterium]